MTLTEEEYKGYLTFTRMAPEGKTALACKMVLVSGFSRSQVVEQTKISASVLSRGLRRLQEAIELGKNSKCPHCGRDIKGAIVHG
ncbi:hypothetical protein Msip34_2898 (plasmid) [Methylovorus glucosotrophus SIP3-4]|uniref:TrfB transcriptional repressor protein domain-containing protein n=1 Tax=Methylovorus glucosotrophus (strain SIP3-4) TaxID=582744 RepID=C6XER5_METGS|nr:hypothetical protein Msip34_2898 [Methylovorus glucosotrophus SIP3-4]